eukprot:9730691-Alexandrium_andersonii.AAC.1
MRATERPSVGPSCSWPGILPGRPRNPGGNTSSESWRNGWPGRAGPAPRLTTSRSADIPV